MTRNEAKDKLLDIMEAVREVHGDCYECPFRGLLDEDFFADCPFADCPERWAFGKENEDDG